MEMESIRFKLILLFSVCLCLLCPLLHATEVRYCDEKVEYSVKVKGVEISPNPVARGMPATFTISATTGEAMYGGEMVIDVSYFGWHIHSETHELCAETACPVSIGDFNVAHSQVLLGFTPPGSYSLKMKMFDGSKNQVTCIEFGFYIGFVSTIADI